MEVTISVSENVFRFTLWFVSVAFPALSNSTNRKSVVDKRLSADFISLSIVTYMNTHSNKDVTGVEYLSTTISPKPNVTDKNLVRQKKIIEGLLDENSPAYRRRKHRPDTSYIRSVTSYYALCVNQANK